MDEDLLITKINSLGPEVECKYVDSHQIEVHFRCNDTQDYIPRIKDIIMASPRIHYHGVKNVGTIIDGSLIVVFFSFEQS